MSSVNELRYQRCVTVRSRERNQTYSPAAVHNIYITESHFYRDKTNKKYVFLPCQSDYVLEERGAVYFEQHY